MTGRQMIIQKPPYWGCYARIARTKILVARLSDRSRGILTFREYSNKRRLLRGCYVLYFFWLYCSKIYQRRLNGVQEAAGSTPVTRTITGHQFRYDAYLDWCPVPFYKDFGFHGSLPYDLIIFFRRNSFRWKILRRPPMMNLDVYFYHIFVLSKIKQGS